MINEGMKNLAAGANPIVLRKGMKKATEAAVEAIAKMSQPISGRDSIARVASISAADDEVGEMVADAMEKVSKDGVITIEESKTMKTELDLVEGMQFDRGYAVSYTHLTNENKKSRTKTGSVRGGCGSFADRSRCVWCVKPCGPDGGRCLVSETIGF